MLRPASHLPPRYARLDATGAPALPLTEGQRAALARFQAKLARGEYATESASCVCGTAESEGVLLAKRDRFGIEVHTHWCPRCGVLWTSPRLAGGSLGRFYQEDYRDLYNGPSKAKPFFEAQARRGREVVAFIDSTRVLAGATAGERAQRPPRVFDVGCGAGGMLLPFHERGWEGFGCDLGGEYLNEGRSRGLTLIHGGADALAPHGPADLLLASHVLEHVPDPLAELARWRSLLAPGGLLYVELPGVLRAYSKYGDFARYLQNAHLYHFTLGTLTATLARAGFVRVGGDESIRSLFRADDGAIAPPVDPAAVLRTLDRHERMNLFWRSRHALKDRTKYARDVMRDVTGRIRPRR